MTEDEMVKTTILIPRDLWRRARIRAAEEDADFRTVVIEALEGLLASPAPSTGMSIRRLGPEEAERMVRAHPRARKPKKGGAR